MKIPDFLSALRLESLFNPYGGTPPFNPSDSMGAQQMPNFRDMFNKRQMGDQMGQQQGDMVFKPQTRFSDMFGKAIENMPQMQEPGKLRRIGAIIAGMGAPPGKGMEVARQGAYAPYYNQMQAWQAQLEPLAKASDDERQNNNVMRQYANQEMTQNMNARKQDEVERRNLATEEDKAKTQERNNKLAELKVFQAQNPNVQFRVVNGSLYALDPATGQAIETGVTGMSDLEKLQFTANAAMDRTIQQGQNQLANTGAVTQREKELIPMRAEEQRKTQAAPKTFAPSTSAGASAAAQKLEEQTRVQQIINTRPDLAQFIVKDPVTGLPGIMPSKQSLFGNKGPTEAQRKELNDLLAGKPSMPTPAQTGKVLVTDPQGNKGYIPASQLNQAIAQGYKRAQ